MKQKRSEEIHGELLPKHAAATSAKKTTRNLAIEVIMHHLDEPVNCENNSYNFLTLRYIDFLFLIVQQLEILASYFVYMIRPGP